MPAQRVPGQVASGLDFAREACEDATLYLDPRDAASIRDAPNDVRNQLDAASE